MNRSILSLRQFLLISLLVSLTVVTGVSTWWTYKNITSEVGNLLDSQLIETSTLLERIVTTRLEQTRHDSSPDSFQTDTVELTRQISLINETLDLNGQEEPQHIYRVFQVWTPDGRLWLKSNNAPNTPLTEHTQTPGFFNAVIDDQDWRVYNDYLPDYDLEFQIAQSQMMRNYIGRTIAMGHFIPLVIMFTILAGFVWFIIHQGIQHIDRFAIAVKQRKPDNLEPIDTHDAPREIKPLLDNLNRLFARLNHAFDHEKRFSADAAHELRTPLAGLKTQAQVALQTNDPITLKKALNHIQTGVDRCAHIIQQLLTINRLRSNQLPETVIVDLNKIVTAEIADLVPVAISKNTTLEFDGVNSKTPPMVEGNATLLGILFRNLIDNAIRYSPKDSLIQARMTLNDESVTVRISDNGPGIPESSFERVFERFYRELGTRANGSGLGLPIVQQIVCLHQGQLQLSKTNDAGGLTVNVTFPRVNSDSEVLARLGLADKPASSS